ncbi:MAG: DUF1573 domain-containing protein [Fimbriimonas sp.]
MRLCALAIALILAGCGPAAAPSLHISNLTVDLGAIKNEGAHQARFEVANRGGSPLHILGVETSCGCTKPSFPKLLQGGQTGTITVDYEPNLLASGPHVEKIAVRTDDPAHSLVELDLKAELRPPLRIEPPMPLRVDFNPGRVEMVELRVTARDGSEAPVSAATVNDPRVPVTVKAEGRSSILSLRLGSSKDAGNYEVKLHLVTNIKSAPFVEARVIGKATTGPTASPAIIDVYNLSAQAKDVRLGTLSIGRASKVLAVRSSDPGLSFKNERQRNGARMWVQVFYRGGWKPGTHRAMIMIQTDDRKLPFIETPVVVQVSE